MRGGMALVAVALGGLLLIGQTVPAVIGFAVCGLGIANAVPLLFSAAGRLDPPGPSLAATFTIGYTGFIVGPPLIGLLADREGLPKTLALLVTAALAVAALGGRARDEADEELSRRRPAKPGGCARLELGERVPRRAPSPKTRRCAVRRRAVAYAPGKNRTCARGLGNHCSIH